MDCLATSPGDSLPLKPLHGVVRSPIHPSVLPAATTYPHRHDRCTSWAHLQFETSCAKSWKHPDNKITRSLNLTSVTATTHTQSSKDKRRNVLMFDDNECKKLKQYNWNPLPANGKCKSPMVGAQRLTKEKLGAWLLHQFPALKRSRKPTKLNFINVSNWTCTFLTVANMTLHGTSWKCPKNFAKPHCLRSIKTSSKAERLVFQMRKWVPGRRFPRKTIWVFTVNDQAPCSILQQAMWRLRSSHWNGWRPYMHIVQSRAACWTTLEWTLDVLASGWPRMKFPAQSASRNTQITDSHGPPKWNKCEPRLSAHLPFSWRFAPCHIRNTKTDHVNCSVICLRHCYVS